MRMLLVRRARMEGFIVFDYRDRYPEATAQLARWVEEGKIAYAEDVVDGLEQAPKVIIARTRPAVAVSASVSNSRHLLRLPLGERQGDV